MWASCLSPPTSFFPILHSLQSNVVIFPHIHPHHSMIQCIVKAVAIERDYFSSANFMAFPHQLLCLLMLSRSAAGTRTGSRGEGEVGDHWSAPSLTVFCPGFVLSENLLLKPGTVWAAVPVTDINHEQFKRWRSGTEKEDIPSAKIQI